MQVLMEVRFIFCDMENEVNYILNFTDVSPFCQESLYVFEQKLAAADHEDTWMVSLSYISWS